MPYKNKEDAKAYQKAWNELHKEERKAKRKAYYEAHKEEQKAYGKAYNKAHKEERKAKKKVYDEAHKEEQKAYRETHREKRKAKQKAYRETHTEEYKAKQKAYYEAHTEEYKAKSNANRLIREYGITIDDYNAMVEEQKGCCKICQKKVKLHVDHCHKTGRVRGLLCHSCNTALGHLRDNPGNLVRAIRYLRLPEVA